MVRRSGRGDVESPRSDRQGQNRQQPPIQALRYDPVQPEARSVFPAEERADSHDGRVAYPKCGMTIREALFYSGFREVTVPASPPF